MGSAPPPSSGAEITEMHDDEWQLAPAIRRTQRRTVVVLIAAQILGTLGVGAGPSVGVLLADHVTASETIAGAARTLSILGAALASIPLAALAARFGRRFALTWGYGLAALGAVALVVAEVAGSVPALLLGMALFGVGSAASLQSRFAASDLAAPSSVTRSLGLVVWCATIGAVLGPNLGVPGEPVAATLGLPALSGAFVLAGLAMAGAAIVLLAFLRPDPLLLAHRHDPARAAGLPRYRPAQLAQSLKAMWSRPDSRFAFLTLVCAQAAMVAVMTMTPVHLNHHGATLTVVGLVISGHIAGMFVLAPVFGWLADKTSARFAIAVGEVILIASAVTGFLGEAHVGSVSVALVLLGLGWSAVTVPASGLLTASLPMAERPMAQGVTDTSMNLAGGLAAALSGPLLAFVGFGALAAIAGLLALPGLALVARRR